MTKVFAGLDPNRHSSLPSRTVIHWVSIPSLTGPLEKLQKNPS